MMGSIHEKVVNDELTGSRYIMIYVRETDADCF